MPTPHFRRAFAGLFALMTASTIILLSPAAAHADDDPLVGWQHDMMNVPQAWDLTRGDGAVIAIQDSGTSEHEYFDDKDVQPGLGVGGGDGLYDKDGHGTAMSGAALSVAPEATLLPLQAAAEFEWSPGMSEFAADQVVWAVDNGVDVINMSWGAPDDSTRLRWAIQYALSNDTVVVVAAGNDSSPLAEDGTPYPARFPGVITVAALDQAMNPSSFTNHGPEVAISAPGEDFTGLNTQTPDDDDLWGEETKEPYDDGMMGTSISAAVVSGAVALIRSHYPDMSAADVVNLILTTAQELGHEDMGVGLIDVGAALTTEPPAPVDENPLGYPMGAPGDPEALLSGQDPETAIEETAADETAALDSEPTAGSSLNPAWGWVGVAVAVAAVAAAIAVYLRRGHGPVPASAPAYGPPPRMQAPTPPGGPGARGHAAPPQAAPGPWPGEPPQRPLRPQPPPGGHFTSPWPDNPSTEETHR